MALRFLVDGEELGRWSGADWEEVSFELPSGEHTLRWEEIGSDCCPELDDIVIIPGFPMPLIQGAVKVERAQGVTLQSLAIRGKVEAHLSSDLKLLNNLITGSPDAGVELRDVISAHLEGNLIEANWGPGVLVVSGTWTSQADLKENLIRLNGGAGLEAIASQVNLLNNTFEYNGGDCEVLADDRSQITDQGNQGMSCPESAHRSLKDLAIELLEVPGKLEPGQKFTIRFALKRSSVLALPDSVQAGFYVSAAEGEVDEPFAVQEVSFGRELSVATEVSLSLPTALPQLRSTQAEGYLVVQVDPQNTVDEAYEGNNFASQPFALKFAQPNSILLLSTGQVFSSLKETVEAAQPGDVLLIGPGTYDKSINIKKALTLKGAGRDSVRMKHISISPAQGITVYLEGIGAGPIVTGGSAQVTLKDCLVSGSKYEGLWVGDTARVEVIGCWISDNLGYGINRSGQARITGRDNWVAFNGEGDFFGFTPPPGFLRETPPEPLLEEVEVCPPGLPLLHHPGGHKPDKARRYHSRASWHLPWRDRDRQGPHVRR